MLKRVVTIQDISCFGKCSSTVALPLISAMGVETAIIPTAVLSTHTGGFTGYTFRDLTADIPKIAAHWNSLQLHFDGIYTGYLGSREQVQIMADFFDTFRSDSTTIVVDPVMGDAGKLYAGFTPDFVLEMRKLCGKADVITPNLTEVSLLLDIPYPEVYTEADIRGYLRRLTELGCRTAVITGVRHNDNQQGAAAYDSKTKQFYTAFREHIPEAMHGTGDIFASVLTGALVRGASVQQALSIAIRFTVDCIQATVDDLHTLPHDQAPWYGVEFEACIGNLVQYAQQIGK
ncbi:MAG: pyridoxamine kinase [Ruminococcus sp.]